MKHTGIIWDLDGTLLNTLEDLMDAVNYALEQFGCTRRSLHEIRSYVGNGAELLIRRALAGTDRESQWQDVLACFRAYYDGHCRIKTAPYPGIMEVLASLRAEGYPMAVVSNKPDSAVQILCGDHFGDLFYTVTGEIAGCPRKPAPDLVFRAAQGLGLPPEQCVYVGDSEVDIQTAVNAKMKCISVLWGFRDEAFLKANGATCFCADPHGFAAVLKEME